MRPSRSAARRLNGFLKPKNPWPNKVCGSLPWLYRSLKPQWQHEHLEEDLVFTGLVGLEDPPRPEVPEALRKCREAGIRVIMVTGDHPRTARAIARGIGLVQSDNPRMITGEQLRHLTTVQLRLALDAPEIIFARVSADQKMRIVEALKQKQHIVAVTGDGVNDAPALKSAHIGIAMGTIGTDVAKEAADMVLLDDNFASIVNAVEEGRAVFENIRKFLTYILAHNVPELIPYLAFVLFKIPLAVDTSSTSGRRYGHRLAYRLGVGCRKTQPAGYAASSSAAARAAIELAARAACLLILGTDRSSRRHGGLLLCAPRWRLEVRRKPAAQRSSLSTSDDRVLERHHRNADRQRLSVPKHDPIGVFSWLARQPADWVGCDLGDRADCADRLYPLGKSYLRNGAYFCAGLALRHPFRNCSVHRRRAAQVACPQDAGGLIAVGIFDSAIMTSASPE